MRKNVFFKLSSNGYIAGKIPAFLAVSSFKTFIHAEFDEFHTFFHEDLRVFKQTVEVLDVVTVKGVDVAIVVGIAIVHGVDAGLVQTVGILLHVHVGKLCAGLVLVPAGDAHGLLAVGHTEACGLEGVGEHVVDLELAQEQAAGGDGLLHPATRFL